VRLRWHGSDCACAACASVARSGGIAAGHTRERRTAVRRDESLNGAGDVDNTFLQDNDFTLYYVVRRAFVTRLYRNRSPQLPLWELGDREWLKVLRVPQRLHAQVGAARCGPAAAYERRVAVVTHAQPLSFDSRDGHIASFVSSLSTPKGQMRRQVALSSPNNVGEGIIPAPPPRCRWPRRRGQPGSPRGAEASRLHGVPVPPCADLRVPAAHGDRGYAS